MEEKHGLRVTLFDKIDTLWKQFDQALKAYLSSTQSRKNEFEDYKRRDDHAAQEIDSQMRRINKLWVCISLFYTFLSLNHISTLNYTERFLFCFCIVTFELYHYIWNIFKRLLVSVRPKILLVCCFSTNNLTNSLTVDRHLITSKIAKRHIIVVKPSLLK